MILLAVALVVTLLIVMFVIPKFAEFFESFDAELPLPTRMLVAIADFVGSPLGVGLIVALIAWRSIGVGLWTRTPKGRRKLHGFLLKVPIARHRADLRGHRAVHPGARRRCSMPASPLPDALPSAVDCTNNLVFQERLTVAIDGVLTGDGFAEPLRATGLFPATVIQMVRVGERTGELSEQLDNAAAFFEDELDYAVEKLTQWFEPIMILFIGVVVGFVALAMVSAMYGIYNQVNV